MIIIDGCKIESKKGKVRVHYEKYLRVSTNNSKTKTTCD